jgi:hypothetical protein
MHKHITSMIFLLAVTTSMSAQIETSTGSSECQSQALPQFVQDYIREHNDAWRIQEPKDLGSRARERWEAEKPLGCPGIAVGKFDNTKHSSYAILLVPITQKARGYKFIVFNPQAGTHLYQPRVVDQSETAESAAFFIHTIAIGGFFDPHSQRKFQVQAQEGILLIDASEREYEADVYFWGAGRYHSQPIDY